MQRRKPFRNCAPIAALLSEVQKDECQKAPVVNIDDSEAINSVSQSVGALGGSVTCDDPVNKRINKGVRFVKGFSERFQAFLRSDEGLTRNEVDEKMELLFVEFLNLIDRATPDKYELIDGLLDPEKYCPTVPSISKAQTFILDNKKRFDGFSGPEFQEWGAHKLAWERRAVWESVRSFYLERTWVRFCYHDLINLSKMSDEERKKLSPMEIYSYFVAYKTMCFASNIHKRVLDSMTDDPKVFGVVMLIELWRPLWNFSDLCVWASPSGCVEKNLNKEDLTGGYLLKRSMAEAMKHYLTTEDSSSETAQVMEATFQMCIGSFRDSSKWKDTKPFLKLKSSSFQDRRSLLSYHEIKEVFAEVCRDIRYDNEKRHLLKHGREKLLKLFKLHWNVNELPPSETEAQTLAATPTTVQFLQSLSPTSTVANTVRQPALSSLTTNVNAEG